MKDIITTGFGMVMFDDVTFSGKNFFGVCIGLVGGISYSFLSYYQEKYRKAEAAKQ